MTRNYWLKIRAKRLSLELQRQIVRDLERLRITRRLAHVAGLRDQPQEDLDWLLSD